MTNASAIKKLAGIAQFVDISGTWEYPPLSSSLFSLPSSPLVPSTPLYSPLLSSPTLSFPLLPSSPLPPILPYHLICLYIVSWSLCPEEVSLRILINSCYSLLLLL